MQTPLGHRLNIGIFAYVVYLAVDFFRHMIHCAMMPIIVIRPTAMATCGADAIFSVGIGTLKCAARFQKPMSINMPPNKEDSADVARYGKTSPINRPESAPANASAPIVCRVSVSS